MNIEYMNDSEEGADDEYDANDSESGLSSAPTTPGSNAGGHGRPDAAAAANAAASAAAAVAAAANAANRTSNVPRARTTAGGPPVQTLFAQMNLETPPPNASAVSPPPQTRSGNRVVVNYDESDMEKLLHTMTPDAVQIGEAEFAWVSVKVPPAFKNGMEFNVNKDGLSSNLSIRIPDNHLEVNNLFGIRLSRESVLYQSLDKEVRRMKRKYDDNPKMQLAFNHPFECERGPSNELFGPETGQSVGDVLIKPRSKDRDGNRLAEHRHAAKDKVSNFCAVIKKLDKKGFYNSSRIVRGTFDNRDITRQIPVPVAQAQAQAPAQGNEDDNSAMSYMTAQQQRSNSRSPRRRRMT